MSKKKQHKGTLHPLPHDRVAVLEYDPTRFVNFTGETDEDFKYD